MKSSNHGPVKLSPFERDRSQWLQLVQISQEQTEMPTLVVTPLPSWDRWLAGEHRFVTYHGERGWSSRENVRAAQTSRLFPAEKMPTRLSQPTALLVYTRLSKPIVCFRWYVGSALVPTCHRYHVERFMMLERTTWMDLAMDEIELENLYFFVSCQ